MHACAHAHVNLNLHVHVLAHAHVNLHVDNFNSAYCGSRVWRCIARDVMAECENSGHVMDGSENCCVGRPTWVKEGMTGAVPRGSRGESFTIYLIIILFILIVVGRPRNLSHIHVTIEPSVAILARASSLSP